MIRLSIRRGNGDHWGVAQTIVDVSTFKGGEVNPLIPKEFHNKIRGCMDIQVMANLRTPTDFLALLHVTDAIRRIRPDVPVSAYIPYVPYARQDRVCNPGESLGIAVAAKLINLCEFVSVTILDPHSDTTPALINRVIVKTQADIVHMLDATANELHDTWLVAPDAGAVKKVKALAAHLGCAGYITATKERDLETMEITKTKFDADVTGKRLLVCDDICDGGRTFIQLAEEIRKHNPARLELLVTHGIFSYGFDLVTEKYDHVYTTNSFHPTAQGSTRPDGVVDNKLTWINA
jgi:ribose-phosphate pyrophosphokinase